MADVEGSEVISPFSAITLRHTRQAVHLEDPHSPASTGRGLQLAELGRGTGQSC